MMRSDNKPIVAMVAEDSASVRGLMHATLTECGIDRVIEAADGADALALLASHGESMDLLFCDLAMPGVDGIDLLRRVALAHPHVSVVVFSAMDGRLMRSVADMAEAMGLAVIGVLGKPFSEAEVRSLIEVYRRRGAPDFSVRRPVLTLEEVDWAIRRNQIEVYYQPKVRFTDGEPAGAEALARLIDPRLGVLGPASFLPVVEATTRFEAISRRVIEQCFRQVGRWKRQGFHLPVAINLAPESVGRPELADWITDLASRHAVSPETITFELTETQGHMTPQMLHGATRLRLKGFRLSVDDFGTGDSGLFRLRSLPFTELKIDRGIVSRAGDRSDLMSVLESSVDLSHRLGLSVVGEGVESWEHWHLLRHARCDLAQGFLASPAMPADRLPEALTQWRARFRAESERLSA